MSRSSGLADDSRVRMHVQDISHRFAEVIEATLYDRNAEPAEQARLCSALFADPDIVAAAKVNTATSVRRVIVPLGVAARCLTPETETESLPELVHQALSSSQSQVSSCISLVDS